MSVIVGTSGYSYKEWKGTFYPSDLPATKMLAFYAQHFGSVEINNTFYRMPVASMVEKWASEVPDGFRFVLKAPQRITHIKRLTGVEDELRYFLETASLLGSKLGPLLFQLPPNLRKDVTKLREFLALIPHGWRVALEVRHDSWCDDEIYALLREHDVPLCLSDTDEVADPDTLLVNTASWGYLRLRRTDYSDAQLADWVRRVESQGWSDAFVFFKHEDEGKGPLFAKRFLERLERRALSPST
ncbi:MAG TPA: DUF72 domain-containing protein [Thermoanaerobaculia bacterium]|nr:DUF72 domain-containing protein [Thermoanaerobaculia bacterium]